VLANNKNNDCKIFIMMIAVISQELLLHCNAVEENTPVLLWTSSVYGLHEKFHRVYLTYKSECVCFSVLATVYSRSEPN